MPHVMRSIVNDVDVRKADHADDKEAEGHRENALPNDTDAYAGEYREMSNIDFLQDCLRVFRSNSSRAGQSWRAQLPGDVPAGEVKIHRALVAGHLDTRRNLEGRLVGAEERLALCGTRIKPQQRAKGAAVNHAVHMLAGGLKGQGLDVTTPRKHG